MNKLDGFVSGTVAPVRLDNPTKEQECERLKEALTRVTKALGVQKNMDLINPNRGVDPERVQRVEARVDFLTAKMKRLNCGQDIELGIGQSLLAGSFFL